MEDEPDLLFCTTRGAIDSIHLECRFSDGQEFVAVKVDFNFPLLAERIADLLNENSNRGKPVIESYATVAENLRNRILDLISSNPQILELEEPWPLFNIEGFECRDLGPTFAQAMWALASAKKLYKATNG